MTDSRNYSSLLIFTFFVFIVSCKTPDTFTYATIYHGHSIEGLHARAITFVNSDAVIVAGPKGVFCGRYFGGELIEQPALTAAEDIRDLHLFDNGTMVMLNSGDTAKIYSIGFNGEQSLAYYLPNVFLDGFDFWDETSGLAYGDPVYGKFSLVKTSDAGLTWSTLTPEIFPSVLKNELGFAASGTGIQCLGDSTIYFATGMADTARLFCSYDRGSSWVAKNTPIKSGGSYGIYSIYFWSEKEGMIIGGSWEETEYNKNICFYTADGGDNWINRSKGLGGYSSCIQGNENGTCIFSTGDAGTYFTLDKGLHWKLVVDRNYYSIVVNKDFVAFTGRDGVLEILRYKY